jgi:hypothetical protein
MPRRLFGDGVSNDSAQLQARIGTLQIEMAVS